MPDLRRAVLSAWLALALVAGCDDDENGWKIRSNVSEVFRSPSAIISTTVITDVDRDGDRIILLRPSNASSSFFIYAHLSLSEDLGKTWHHVQVRREVASELGGDTFQIGVH